MQYSCIVLCAVMAAAQAGIIGAPAVVAPGAPLGYGAPIARVASPYGLAAPALAHAPLGIAPVARVAAPLGIAAPAIAKAVVDADYDPNPQYNYAYDIQDALTGDSKNQQESRSGDVVQGSYSLTEPDGTRRTVEYTADPINGFNAVVHKTPLGVPAVAAHAPVVAAHAPLAPRVLAPAPLAPRVLAPAPLSPLAPRVLAPAPLAPRVLAAPALAYH